MNKRDQVKIEATEIALKNKKCGLAISMGVGKTLIGLLYLEALYKNDELKKALIVAPKLSIFDTWKAEVEKHNIDKNILNLIEFTTYLSLHKEYPSDYNVVILDECHNLLYSHTSFLGVYTGRILGLTGTPPRFPNSEKGEMVFRYCPIMYTYITDDAVEDEILNDYRIIVHKLPLSRYKNFGVKTKKGNVFYTTEKDNYDYWSKRIDDAGSKAEERIASIMRMKMMMEYRSKEAYAKKLLEDIEDKCIVFCNTQEQADRICKHSVHSGNQEADANLQMFKDDKIQELSCVLQLNEGINIPNLRAGIILHAYGNERKSNQRIGRLLRLNPDDLAIVHILCYKDTVDEKWVRSALKDLDPEKIMYHEEK